MEIISLNLLSKDTSEEVMKKNHFGKKVMAVGIILLFVGIAVNPITGISNNRDDTIPPYLLTLLNQMARTAGM
jgi:hypothetical protein